MPTADAVRGAIELVKISSARAPTACSACTRIPGPPRWSPVGTLLPQGSKVAINDEFFAPIADMMNGAITAQQWAEGIEELFTQIQRMPPRPGNKKANLSKCDTISCPACRLAGRLLEGGCAMGSPSVRAKRLGKLPIPFL